MNKKKALICLSIIAILTICVPNVAAAPVSKSITTTGGAHITDVRAAQQPTTLTLTAPSQATANVWFDVTVHLTTAGGTGIPNAQINFQKRYSSNDRWIVMGDEKTDLSGYVHEQIRSQVSGEVHYRVTYGGDGLYAPSVSNEVIIMID